MLCTGVGLEPDKAHLVAACVGIQGEGRPGWVNAKIGDCVAVWTTFWKVVSCTAVNDSSCEVYSFL